MAETPRTTDFMAKITAARRAADAAWVALNPKPTCRCGKPRFDRTILVCRDCWDEAGANEPPWASAMGALHQ